MRILALGGCGEMGSVAVRAMIDDPAISDIVIADRDQAKASAFAKSLGRKASAIHVDAQCDRSLKQGLQGCDVVVSTIGPYYLFGPRVLSAAIQAGVHYLDICDDPEPTMDMLALDSLARDNRVAAIIGAGASPGVSNLLAARALAAQPHAEEIYTFWGTGGPLLQEEELSLLDNAGNPTAATQHWIQQVSGQVKVYQHGTLTPVTPLQAIHLAFPGSGSDRCHVVGHPEPITLPRYYPRIRQSLNLMNMPGYLIYALEKAAKGMDQDDPQSIQKAAMVLTGILSDSTIQPQDIAHYLIHRVKDRFRRFLPPLGAVARGPDGNGKTRVTGVRMRARLKVDDMAHSTCLPTAIILRMLINGEIKPHGVMAPEACVNPDIFFRQLATHMILDDGVDATGYVDCQTQQIDQPYTPLRLPQAHSARTR